MGKVIDHPERLDMLCSDCGKTIRPDMKKRFKLRGVVRVRISPCCEAEVVRDSTSARDVKKVKGIIAKRSGVNDDSLRDMRAWSVPLHLFSKKDLIRLLHVITEKMLRSEPTHKSMQDVLIRIGMAGTSLPNATEFAESCDLGGVCPKVKAARGEK